VFGKEDGGSKTIKSPLERVTKLSRFFWISFL
jgi:hypothetical protein